MEKKVWVVVEQYPENQFAYATAVFDTMGEAQVHKVKLQEANSEAIFSASSAAYITKD